MCSPCQPLIPPPPTPSTLEKFQFFTMLADQNKKNPKTKTTRDLDARIFPLLTSVTCALFELSWAFFPDFPSF